MLKKRTLFFAIFLGVFLLSYYVGAIYPISYEEAQSFLKDFENSTSNMDAMGIFFHNTLDTLPMFIPGFGIAWGSYISWSTGVAFHELIVQNPEAANLSPFTIFLESPFGAMELFSYSLAMSQSLSLLIVLVRKKGTRQEVIPTMIAIGISVVVLLAAGFVEFYMVGHT